MNKTKKNTMNIHEEPLGMMGWRSNEYTLVYQSEANSNTLVYQYATAVTASRGGSVLSRNNLR